MSQIFLKKLGRGKWLQYVLRDFVLTWYRRDGAIHVTTPEACEASTLETHRYPIGDLTAGPFGAEDRRRLVELVTSIVAPETWKSVGRYGVVSPVENELVVLQTQAAHRQIAAMLKNLRHALLYQAGK